MLKDLQLHEAGCKDANAQDYDYKKANRALSNQRAFSVWIFNCKCDCQIKPLNPVIWMSAIYAVGTIQRLSKHYSH